MVGLPAALLLAYVAGLGVLGLWAGLGVGLTVTAVIMWWRFWAATTG
ncbi:hypothetical protein [Enemella dayhoffiae]|nr:hypothetical protein [Enemella dayhoffiae]